MRRYCQLMATTKTSAKTPRTAPPKTAQKAGAKTGAPKRKGRKKPQRGPLRRILRFAAIVVVVLIALPVVLVPVYAVVRPPFSTLEAWTRLSGVSVKKQWMPISEIAPDLAYAVIMSEDGKFCAHHGVDWSAVWDVIDSEASRGASTIPMQVAKNLFLWQSRSYVRKALEVPLAYYMDFVWSKRRMMEIYLNIVEWGPGVFGAEAAAQHWFNVPAARLSRRQASLLVAVLPNPIARNPAKPGRATSRIAGIIEQRTRQAGAYVKCVQEGG